MRMDSPLDLDIGFSLGKGVKYLGKLLGHLLRWLLGKKIPQTLV